MDYYIVTKEGISSKAFLGVFSNVEYACQIAKDLCIMENNYWHSFFVQKMQLNTFYAIEGGPHSTTTELDKEDVIFNCGMEWKLKRSDKILEFRIHANKLKVEIR